MMKAPWTEGNMTKYPVPYNEAGRTKMKDRAAIVITNAEAKFLAYIGFVVVAGGIVVAFTS